MDKAHRIGPEITLYRVNTGYGGAHFVACESFDALCDYVAELSAGGSPIFSVCEITVHGDTPRVRVLSSKRYQQTLRKLIMENRVERAE